METRKTLPAHVEAEKSELAKPGQFDAQNENMASQQQASNGTQPRGWKSHSWLWEYV